MKCIRNKLTKKISRVDNRLAYQLVQQGLAEYVAKKLWKEEVRGQWKLRN